MQFDMIRVGDVLKTRLMHLSLGDVGFLFLPGELAPELVRGLPRDYDRNPGKYVTQEPALGRPWRAAPV